MSWIFLGVAWLALACTVLGLAVYRNLMAYSEDDLLHLHDGDGRKIASQKSIAGHLDFADRWGKTLTVVTLVFGMLLAAAYLYEQWAANYQLIP